MVLHKQNLDTFCSFFTTESSSHLINEQKCIEHVLDLQAYNEAIKLTSSGDISSRVYSILAKLFVEDQHFNAEKDLNLSEIEICVLRKLLFDLDQNIKAFIPNLPSILGRLKSKLDSSRMLNMKSGKNPFSIKGDMLDVMALSRSNIHS